MKGKSLTAKTVRFTVMSSVMLGLIALLIGLIIHGYALVQQSIRLAYETAAGAADMAKESADSVKLANDVMERYRSLTPEQRAKKGTEEYHEYFSNIDGVSQKGGAHDILSHMLRNFVFEVDYVYLAMYDRDTCAMVYIADSDPLHPLYPGEWEAVNERQMLKMLDWDGKGMLYVIGHPDGYGWLCTAGYPIRDSNGKICEFLLVDVSVNSIMPNLSTYALHIGLALLLVTALIAMRGAKRMKIAVTEPIDAITNAAVNYVQDKRSGSPVQNHFASLGIQTGDELENLSHVMADMERDLAQHEEQITRITADRERIVTELDMAAKIQRGMLPHDFPPFPDRTEFDLYASMDPARDVGGDFYDYFLIDDDHLCLVIADVSGKGIPAALFMMAAKIIIQSCVRLGQSAGEVLTKTNEAICSSNQAEMFITVWLGILEISTGRLTAANAGHEYPAVRKPDGSFELMKDRHGLVIGAMEDIQYHEYEITLEPGTGLFVYTDGVTEATDAENRLFGTGRMLEALNEEPDAAPEQVLKNVRSAVDRFVKDVEPFDDLTMLCLKYNGAKDT